MDKTIVTIPRMVKRQNTWKTALQYKYFYIMVLPIVRRRAVVAAC
ncbi:hypothetical protein [Paenibacillus alba]|uniref:Uncharacterized protein n=1 Tax=Paenibacillus alba TaxID=1197127 RepID=A0ABU6G129_9BACL|nr:hypothetical protein [Paenibacillus alba]MEC0227671.1 hypothetical protein [Paenibacillus alba]